MPPTSGFIVLLKQITKLEQIFPGKFIAIAKRKPRNAHLQSRL